MQNIVFDSPPSLQEVINAVEPIANSNRGGRYTLVFRNEVNVIVGFSGCRKVQRTRELPHVWFFRSNATRREFSALCSRSSRHTATR